MRRPASAGVGSEDRLYTAAGLAVAKNAVEGKTFGSNGDGAMSRKGRNPVPKGETPRDRFIRLAESRTNVALDKIRLIGNLSGSQYEYTQEDIEQIFAALEEAIKSARERFDLGKKKAEEQFRLRVSIEAEAPESPPEEEVREEEPAYGTAEYTDVPEEGERRPEDQ